jgi:hypothetical protein
VPRVLGHPSPKGTFQAVSTAAAMGLANLILLTYCWRRVLGSPALRGHTKRGKFMKVLRIIPATVLALSGILIATVASSTAETTGAGYTCSSGDIAAGTYSSVRVTGLCYAPAGNIHITGNLTVAPGAFLDASTPGDPSSSPLVPATVSVGGNVFVGPGGVLFLGCSPFIFCSSAVSYDTIRGSLKAVDSLGVVLHSVHIGRNFSLLGGGNDVVGRAACATIPATWSEDPSLAGIPVYSDSEDDTVGGNFTISGLTSCWLGTLRNRIGGTATFVGNTMGDPDANEIDNNLVLGNLVCYTNKPAVQFGDSGSSANAVEGNALGQCGYGVTALNPAPRAHEGHGVREHLALHMAAIGKYSGIHRQTSSTSTVLGTTSSGDTIVFSSGTDVLSGTGLTGPVNEIALSTVFPTGAGDFYAEDICECSFDGQSGTVTILAKGTTNAKGWSIGTFQVVSGGTQSGGLATLVGYGRFHSVGKPDAGVVAVVEHLSLG